MYRYVKKLTLSLLQVFFPTFVSRVGFTLMSLVDGVVLAHYSTKSAGIMALGDMPIYLLIMLINSLTQGVLYKSAEAYGSAKKEKAGAAWRYSLRNNFLISTAMMLVCFLVGRHLFIWTGQPMDVAIEAEKVMFILAIGLPFGGIYDVSQFFLQGIKRSHISMYIVLATNVLNLLLNLVLVFGFLGFPELGLYGSACATTGTRMILSISVVAYILLMKDYRTFGTRLRQKLTPQEKKSQNTQGLGAAAAVVSENLAYAANVVIAGWMGLTAVAAYSLVFRFFQLIFRISLAIAVSAAFFVSRSFVRENWQRIKVTVWTSIGLNAFIFTILGLCMIVFRGFLASLLTQDVQLQQDIQPLLIITSFVSLAYGTQGIFIILLRSLYDVKIPSLFKVIYFPFIFPAVSYLFGITLGWGVVGLMASFLLSMLLSTALFAGRFIWITRYKQVSHKQ